MAADRVRVDVAPAGSSPLLEEVLLAWPPATTADARGYRRAGLPGLVPVDVLALDAEHLLVVVTDDAGRPAALPCHRGDHGLQVSRAGDGTATAFAGQLARDRLAEKASVSPRFSVELLASFALESGTERELDADQSNHSVVVGERWVVKWRTASDSDGQRSVRLRRHLRATGFVDTPSLAGYLRWTDDDGEEVVLADVDEYLRGAVDGWDHAIAHLRELITTARDGEIRSGAPGATLGALTARMHVAMAQPSPIIPRPRNVLARTEVERYREEALATVRSALEQEAAEPIVTTHAARLLAEVAELPVRPWHIQPVHGDLHVGQFVAWDGGLAVIDFDGPPGRRKRRSESGPTARDVAQLLVSLGNLAAVVDQRTEGVFAEQLKAWKRIAQADALEAYRATAARLGLPGLLDERLLEPYVLERLGAELLYAARVLPRWRYAPLTTLTWRLEATARR